tara:strand:+ start:1463 stop:2434 length:972 start_codon:yes stop_codon:yes gene_type:complete
MPYGRTGIENLGNTCYMAASIQCLSHTVDLTKYYITEKYKINLDTENSNSLNEEFHSVLRNLWGNHQVVKIGNLKNLISIKMPNFRGNLQHDPQEFIIEFLDKLHESMKFKKEFNILGDVVSNSDKLIYDSCKEYIKAFENNYSKIVDLFYGQAHQIVVIPEVEYKSYQFPIFSSLELSITDSCENIYDMFDHYTSIEHEVERTIEETGYSTKNASKKDSLWKLPKILIISLKRFTNSMEKINKHIDFPIENLDLDKYCIDIRSKKNKYSLYGIINHYGPYGGGHYTAYCKNNGGWYEFNDSTVSEAEEIVTKNAYVLFYKRK